MSVNFGIVADVTADPGSFLAGRANPELFGTDVTTLIGRIVEAVDSGRLTPEQIDEAAYKLLVLRGRVALRAVQE
ncbi:hypothetical protein [Cryobacterium sp. TMT3-29-2]|uniref:hypothetical protein n=1 Tax=Cryobacterium sp. TMT3-29-2 TaxID=2555867 RepID=UPI0010735788|nr:hypothetical protein [Cryobacterium sp. TMT3-29-2]TFC91951.1 hypothetical protein E3O67_04070 [Cryobacterium sp. TMT3-29-2]